MVRDSFLRKQYLALELAVDAPADEEYQPICWLAEIDDTAAGGVGAVFEQQPEIAEESLACLILDDGLEVPGSANMTTIY
jgi:hypothetical protein